MTGFHTKLIRSINYLQPVHQGGVVTLGHFDGVHRGHQHLLQQTISKAKALGVPSIVVTFEPHAFEYFAKGKAGGTSRLTRLREKFIALADTGIDYVLILKFNQQLAGLSANDFIELLFRSLKPSCFVLGDDFRFGRGRNGDAALFRAFGLTNGFEVEQVNSCTDQGERISSTRIRQALLAGNHSLAEKLLGRIYSMHGRVSHGLKLGRKLGFPTANIFLHRQQTPLHGIYTVYVHGICDYPIQGVANVGTRPTIGGTKALLEIYLLDFSADIYDRYVQVDFCKKLRDEEHYPTLDILKEHIALDVEMARAYFNKDKKVSNE